MIRLLRKAPKKNLRGTAFLRLDFNTEGEWRMKAAIPTIRFLLRTAEKVIVVSHRGRPRGVEKKLSLEKDGRRLSRYLGKRVHFIPHFRFALIKAAVVAAPKRSVFLLENLRFLPGEERNDPRLAKKFAGLADFYVNDAFAVSHRDDVSVDAITRFLPSYAGLELEQEIRFLTPLRERPRQPLIVILGGAKAHDKLKVIRYLRNKARAFLLGGAPANTLLKMRGVNVGKSLTDEVAADKRMLKEVLRYKNVLLPVDWNAKNGAIFDIGGRTARLYSAKIKSARTIVWSGPLGLTEKKRFARGTLAVARAVAGNRQAFSAVGGGETVMFLKKHRLDTKISFISTGGGAMLEFLAGEKLPGIEALKSE